MEDRQTVPIRKTPCDGAWQTATMSVRYLEDYAAGQVFSSGRLKVDVDAIKAFAAAFDPRPFHLEEAAASLFGSLAASGWHTAALTMRLLVDLEARPSRSQSGRGILKVRSTTYNQHDEPVQVAVGNLVVSRRAA